MATLPNTAVGSVARLQAPLKNQRDEGPLRPVVEDAPLTILDVGPSPTVEGIVATVAEFYGVFDAAGFLVPCTWTPQPGGTPVAGLRVRYRAPSTQLFGAPQYEAAETATIYRSA